jgi:NAD(P)-dependent dehydrogenase (short-subunit alcohol dehydrogenase family)
VSVPPAGPVPVLLVTGASSGIGRAVALQASAAGQHVALVSRGKQSLAAAARECELAGAASVMTLPADVGDDAAVRDAVQAVVDRHGRLDAVVQSAGVAAYGRTEDVPPEVFEGVLRTNLLGAVNVARHVLPVLRRQQRGSLVQIGSVIGHIAVPLMSPYVLSKWGVRALLRQLQLENRDLPDVHLMYLAPGGVDTPIYLQAANYAGFVGRPPPPVASPEHVASVVMRRLERPRKSTQVGVANDLMRLGFTALPGVFDALVNPLFRLAARDMDDPVPPVTGNVLDSHQDANRLHGEQGNALLAIVRNAVRAAQEVGKPDGHDH